jgi:hypothetical protein
MLVLSRKPGEQVVIGRGSGHARGQEGQAEGRVSL